MVQAITHRLAQRRRARGFAMIAMVTMIALISSYLLANVLTRTSTEVRLDNDLRTQQALQEAKAALIAYAASQAWTGNSANDQPGSLPCPAINEDGDNPGNCTTAASTRIGRLPWKAIGASQLRDGSGNVLWYALSANFRKDAGTTVINSDTAGTLTITGASPATNLVAVIIAPGSPVSGQIRTSSSAVDTYLEGSNAGNTDSFVTASISSDTFNDQIIPVTQGDLMAVVEPAVVARIERDIKPYLTSYATQWSGVYPFASLFNNGSPNNPGNGVSSSANYRSQDSYIGTTNTAAGLLPITASATYPWTSGSGSVTLTGGTAGGISGVSCSSVTSPSDGWRCDFSITAKDNGSDSANWGPCTDSSNVTWRYCMLYPAFQVSGQVSANAALSIVELPDATSEVLVTSTGGATRSMSSKAISGAIALVSGTPLPTVTFQGTHSYTRYRTSSFSRNMRVFIPDITVSPVTSSTDSDAGWFIAQQWYRQTYYAVSAGYLPGGSGSCTAGTTCLTVSELPSSRYPTKNDKRAILVFMGRVLNNTSRPSSTLSDYLEGENATPVDNIFVHRAGMTTSSNDRAVVLAP